MHTLTIPLRPAPALLLALLLPASAALAGGYMRSGEETYASAGVKLDYGDRYFDKGGQRRDGGCAAGMSVPLYVDHGWSYYTNVFASTSLRAKDCPGQSAYSMGDTEVGLRRRLDPLSDAWVWEAALILPTSRVGATRASDAAEFGYDLGLHWRPRPDPYRLDLDRDPLAGAWDFGTGLRGWTGHLPLEWWAYASYSKALGETLWSTGQRGWRFNGSLRWRQSIARAHATGPAVDAHDGFRILDLNLGFSYPLSPLESLHLSFNQSLLGRNRDDSSGISLTYGKTFR